MRRFAFDSKILSHAARLALFCCVSIVPAARAGAVTLTCAVVDSASGELLPARCRVIDQYGYKRFPPLLTSLYHTAMGGYFYTEGVFSVSVPAGRTILSSGRGFEYCERVDTIALRADTIVVLPLARRISPAESGWYSGDTHVHIDHAGGYYTLTPAQACLMGRAEGLSAVNCLDNTYCFTGGPSSCGSPDCVVWMSEEWRSSSYGHMGFLGLRSIVEPVSSIWWPLAMDAVDSCRAHGGIAVSLHPVTTDDFYEVETWSGSGLARELPIDALSGRVDAMDVMSYSNVLHGGIECDLWYRLLNCGFRLPASAGTDAAMNRLESPPLGGYRVYVRLDGGGFEFGEWLRGLASGRTFVTNGPLITEFSVDGAGPGGEIWLPIPGRTVHGEISVRSLHPVDLIEIIVNGEALAAMPLAPSRCSIDTSFTLTILESAWVAARVTGSGGGWMTVGSSLFAHTSPVYMIARGRPVIVPEDAFYFVQWIDSLVALGAEKGFWTDPEAESRFLSECASARAYYEYLSSGAVAGGEDGADHPPSGLRVANVPNPFSGRTTIEFSVPGRSEPAAAGGGRRAGIGTSIAIFDVSGRVVRRIMCGQLEPGTHRITWDGKGDLGAPLARGVYFARVTAGSSARIGKMVLLR